MDSTTFPTNLPPLKRHRLIHHHQQQQQNTPTPSPLPTKKRKESRNSSANDAVSPPPIVLEFGRPILNNDDTVSPSPIVYPLPTKKRVFALQLHNHHNHHNDAVSVSPPPPSLYSLPTKKRVLALQPQPNDAVSPFDLNVEYQPEKPEPESELIPESEPEPEPIPESEPEPEPIPESEPEPEPESQQEEDAITEEDDEDGILCCVCQSTDGDPSDPIVFCDGCDLMVHASCYGNPLSKSIPDGDWFCERCCSGERDGGGECCNLCPMKDGAMKRTTEGGWAHVVCALIVPEVFFSDPEGRDGIDCSKVPTKRWSERCYVCGCGGGCTVVCSEPKCRLAFHATCALKEQLCIEYKEDRKGATIVAGFCKTHSLLWEKQQLSGKYKIVAIEDKK